jgi:TM2 domain-containing membrane protein YozV
MCAHLTGQTPLYIVERNSKLAATPKKPWVAFLLSILLPGVGLAYLGKWGWAALNLLIVIAITVLLVFVSPDLSAPIAVGVCTGSGVLAKNLAEKINKEFSSQTSSAATSEPPVIKVSTDSVQSATQPITVTPGMVVCEKCGSSTEVANFCAECGAPLTQGG